MHQINLSICIIFMTTIEFFDSLATSRNTILRCNNICDNSLFMFDFLLTFVPFVRANWFFIILFIFAFSVDFTLRRYRARVKAQVYAKHEQELQVNINEGQNKKRNAEFYIEYYKKVQILDTIRIAFIVFVIVVFLAEKT